MSRRMWIMPAITLVWLLSASPVAAASRVDPATLTPPLNPDFAPWRCQATGAGSICRGALTFSWVHADTGLACDGQTIVSTGSATIDTTRWSDRDGRAVHSDRHSEAVETWSLAGTSLE